MHSGFPHPSCKTYLCPGQPRIVCGCQRLVRLLESSRRHTRTTCCSYQRCNCGANFLKKRDAASPANHFHHISSPLCLQRFSTRFVQTYSGLAVSTTYLPNKMSIHPPLKQHHFLLSLLTLLKQNSKAGGLTGLLVWLMWNVPVTVAQVEWCGGDTVGT